jgi:hypothetical protein
MTLRLPAMDKKAGAIIFTKSFILNPFDYFLWVHLKMRRRVQPWILQRLYLKPQHSWHFSACQSMHHRTEACMAVQNRRFRYLL